MTGGSSEKKRYNEIKTSKSTLLLFMTMYIYRNIYIYISSVLDYCTGCLSFDCVFDIETKYQILQFEVGRATGLII